ncbi:MAG: cyclic nucleotide-binding domain-containing protein [Pseudonocardiaceae bacterium]|nr:cyclic nucleotide-binding domain-containing protein [Pseudonocardiaceae bacterium]
MTVTDSAESDAHVEDRPQQSLSTAAARNLATTTKSVPQMQGISPRWLLRMLPWVQLEAGTYRVNRRLTYAVGDGRVTCTNTGSEVHVIPEELSELPLLRGYDEPGTLHALADRFEQRQFDVGDEVVAAGQPADGLVVIAHGKANKVVAGKYGDASVLGMLADGDHAGHGVLVGQQQTWGFTLRAVTACTVLVLRQQAFEEVAGRSETLRAHVEAFRTRPRPPMTKRGEAEIALAAGHEGETDLPTTFADYELSPREYELSVAQAVLRVHTRVADLFNNPMNQTEQQLRLTIEALRERQEHELINNRDFGLLHNVDLSQRVPTRSGPPTPDDLDDILSRRRKSKFFLAHPRTIAAFGRECTRRGLYPATTSVEGRQMLSWRGVPILPCNKIPVSDMQTSSILVMRTGEDDQGVVGLHQTGIPHEYRPSLSVQFMGINEKAVISYLVSAYFSAAVLVPDALGVLEHVEIGR